MKPPSSKQIQNKCLLTSQNVRKLQNQVDELRSWGTNFLGRTNELNLRSVFNLLTEVQVRLDAVVDLEVRNQQ